MTAIIWADVTAVASELASTAGATQTMILAYVNDALSVDAFGGEDSATLTLARAYLAAHMATAGARGAPGQVSAESAGGLSRSYAVDAASSGSSYGSTAYGQQYLALVNRSPARAGVAL